MDKKENSNQNITIPQMEEETLSYWLENKIFERSVEKNPKENLYVFYDGPPFISGLPHYGHLLGSIAKDIVPRYWTMKGKRVERVWGWDAHGLTVENKVQKKFGIKNRRDIEKFGLERFTQECYNYTRETSAEWDWYVNKIGRWVDIKNAYRTTDQNYMESVMWTFKQLYDKGLVYEGIRTSLYCTKCGTPVSNFEIAMDNSYKDVEDPAITVKFKIRTDGEFKNAFALAWTTTPWTIPSNRALVVDKDADYTLVESDGSRYITAEARNDNVFSGREFKVLKKIKGADLVGLKYEPPFRFYSSKEGEFEIYHYEGMVSMEEGTGIVHSAPGFGEIDSEMGKHFGLTLMLTIDDEGKFLPGTEQENPYTGVFYKDADPLLINDMITANLLFKSEKIVHRFPYHDRCDTLLIQRAQQSWFIDVNSLKPRMTELNERINWIPEHLKHGRFGQNIQQQPDWCISRNRYWATPMPVWESEDGDRIVVSSVKEIEELSGQKVEDLHRPYIDKIIIKKDGKEYKRRLEVLDSWLEAGSMPWAQIHYPFENKEKFETNYPGDYIVEYIAQVRAWFNVMHILSTAVFDSNSFKNVISTGVMAGSDGRKMSKTFNNYTDPRQVLQDYGGDALRLYLMGSPLMIGDNANFEESELRTKLRNVLNPLWNSLKYFQMYAAVYNWKNSEVTKPEHILDTWITARLHEVIKTISTGMEEYRVPVAVRAVEEFVDDLSRWYVRRSRDRISAGDKGALSTLYTVLFEFSRASAPVIPFMSENIYRILRVFSVGDTPESVHLEQFPGYDNDFILSNQGLLENMKKVRDLVSYGLSIRSEKKISVRQPLSSVAASGVDKVPQELSVLILDELNVKEIQYVTEVPAAYASASFNNINVGLDTNITDELKYEGLSRDFVRKIQEMRKEAGLKVGDIIEITYPSDPDTAKVIELYGEEISKKIQASNLTAGPDFTVRKVN